MTNSVKPLPTAEYGNPISLAEARRVMEAAEQEAIKQGGPMVIAICDSTGHLVMLHKLDQAQYGSVHVAQQKAQTAVNFRRSTQVFEAALAEGGMGMRLLGMDNLLPLEGGLPLIREGKVIGSIGVSGMQSTQDGQVAKAGVEALRH